MPNPTDQLLWQLTHPGVPDRASYLFGTMHVRDERAFTRLDRIREVLLGCESFAAELDLSAPEAVQMGTSLHLPPSEWLDQQVRPPRYRRLCRIARKAFGLELHSLRALHPLFIQQMLSETLLADDYPEALDSHLFRLAQEADKQVLGLETWQEQLATLEAIPLAEMWRNLLQTLGQVRAFRRQHEKLVELYVAGDIRGLYQHIKKSTGAGRFHLIYLRNQIMTQRIWDQHQQASTFFAAGAGHLWGGKGILRGLKHRGFELNVVPLSIAT